MRKVFVSGCFDILHGGHIEFLDQARALGDYLIVCVPDDEGQFIHKHRKPFLPLDHKVSILRSLRSVDEVVVGTDPELGLNFRTEFIKARPQILAVTADDRFEWAKRVLCQETGAEYVQLPKELGYKQISSTELFQRATAPVEAPLRVDLAGGWLDVPKFARGDGYIVNCTIQPLVSLHNWPYETSAGLGGSATYAYLSGRDCIRSELDNGVGWQDPAVVQETGLCVWCSGAVPVLDMKSNPRMLMHRMALYWTGKTHVTKEQVERKRDYDTLAKAGQIARMAVRGQDFNALCHAVSLNYAVQVGEGMNPLPDLGQVARKYCGGGHGGYAVYLFDRQPSYRQELRNVEPYMKNFA